MATRRPNPELEYQARVDRMLAECDDEDLALLKPVALARVADPAERHRLNGKDPRTCQPVVSDAWRSVKLTDTGIPAKLIDALRDGKVKNTNDAAQIETLGQLADFTHKRKLTDVAGIGPAKAETIEEAVADFYIKHPEYCGGEKAAPAAPATDGAYVGLVWKPGQSEFQWVADNTAGIKTDEDEPAQFVITTDAGDVRIDLSSDRLMPGQFPEFFETLEGAQKWCRERNRMLCLPEAREQMPEAFGLTDQGENDAKVDTTDEATDAAQSDEPEPEPEADDEPAKKGKGRKRAKATA